MGREVRRVPANWEHPKGERGHYIPMYAGGTFTKEELQEFDEEPPMMPNWPEEERTHFQMYEDTSEGTPISPVMASIEELARWLADTGASAFADMPASYEAWLRTCQIGSAVSAVSFEGGPMLSGVEANLVESQRREEKESD